MYQFSFFFFQFQSSKLPTAQRQAYNPTPVELETKTAIVHTIHPLIVVIIAMHLTHDLTISAKGNESLFINSFRLGKGTKERKEAGKRESSKQREIQSNYRRNTSELENKVLSLVLPFPVSRCYSFIRSKRSFPRQEISFFFLSLSLFFDLLPLIFTRRHSIDEKRRCSLKLWRMIIMTDIPCDGIN